MDVSDIGDLLDLDRHEVMIDGRRISVWDVYQIAEGRDEEEAEEIFDDWDLSLAEVEAALEYAYENEEEIREIEAEKEEWVRERANREADIETTYWDKCAWLCPDCDGHLELVQSGEESIEPRDQYTDNDERTEAWFAAKNTFPGVKCYECERLYVARFEEVSAEALREKLDEE